MNRTRRLFEFSIILLSAMNLLSSTVAGAETGPYIVRAQVVVTQPEFESSFDVFLLRDGVREVGRLRTASMVYFHFSHLPAGTYVIALNIPGFKPIREPIDVHGPQREITTQILVDREVTAVPERSGVWSITDYEDDNLVAASELAQYPKDLPEEARLAHETLLRRDFDGALRRLDSIVHEFPEYYPARRDRGVVFQKLGRYTDARLDYEMARDLKPSSPVPLIYLAGLSLLESGSASLKADAKRALIADAVDDLRKAIAIWPRGYFAYYLLGVAYYEAEFYEDAEDSFLRALKLEPGYPETHVGLANLYIKINEWDKALVHLDTYIAGAPRPGVLQNLQRIRSRVQRIIHEQEDAQASQGH
jgi:Flp pilus assembly protein TadD